MPLLHLAWYTLPDSIVRHAHAAVNPGAAAPAAVQDDGGVYLLMSRCQGWQLAELLERCGFFTEEYAAWATR
jgi:hypothetical protein